MKHTDRFKPNFFVVGTFKGGTTSIHRYLSQHPDIFMPALKEPRYFAYDPDNPDHRNADAERYPVRSEEDYLDLFNGVAGERAIGEASPIYLDSPLAPGRIARFNPDAKIIVSLRDPISRAVSGYQMWVRSGKEHRTMTEALRPGERWIEGSLYAEKLGRYYDNFPSQQIKVLLFDDLVADATSTVEKLFEFVGVAPNYVPDTRERFNAGGMPRSRIVQSILHRVKHIVHRNPALKRLAPGWLRRAYGMVKIRNLDRISIPTEIDRMLAQYYASDVEEVARLTGLQTDVWRLHERARA
jgi:Sulfotransferase family